MRSSRARCSKGTLGRGRTSSGRRRAWWRASSAGPGVAGPARRCAAGSRLDEDAFYATFYCASVTRCYPGRAPAGGGDRTPAAREQELCSFWREWELRLLQPRLIVPVGGLAIRRLLGSSSLDASVGRRLRAWRRCGRPTPAPVGCEPLDERRREPASRRVGRGAHPGRARDAERRPGTGTPNLLPTAIVTRKSSTVGDATVPRS